MPEIINGQPVDIVVEHGVIKPSSVQDILADRMVFLQIAPPLSGKYINKTILITYLPKEDRAVRWCFHARVIEICEGYVTVGRGFPAIIVERSSPTRVCDLRVHERRLPPPGMKIKLGADDLEIIDISEGGAHLVRTAGKKLLLQSGEAITLSIQHGSRQYDRIARVVRQWHSRGVNGPEHFAVMFAEEK